MDWSTFIQIILLGVFVLIVYIVAKAISQTDLSAQSKGLEVTEEEHDALARALFVLSAQGENDDATTLSHLHARLSRQVERKTEAPS